MSGELSGEQKCLIGVKMSGGNCPGGEMSGAYCPVGRFLGEIVWGSFLGVMPRGNVWIPMHGMQDYESLRAAVRTCVTLDTHRLGFSFPEGGFYSRELGMGKCHSRESRECRGPCKCSDVKLKL